MKSFGLFLVLFFFQGSLRTLSVPQSPLLGICFGCPHCSISGCKSCGGGAGSGDGRVRTSILYKEGRGWTHGEGGMGSRRHGDAQSQPGHSPEREKQKQ